MDDLNNIFLNFRFCFFEKYAPVAVDPGLTVQLFDWTSTPGGSGGGGGQILLFLPNVLKKKSRGIEINLAEVGGNYIGTRHYGGRNCKLKSIWTKLKLKHLNEVGKISE